MLKGLEISEIYYSQLLSGVETLRFDSEYYLKEYVNIESFISNNRNKFSNFKDWNVNIDCSAFYPGIEPFYGKGEMPIIRVQNVKDCIDYDNCETLPLLGDKYSTLKFVNEGDIVITKGGTIGFVGYVTQRAYASRDLIFVNTSTLSQEQQIYLYLYFSTNFAYKQLIRSSSQCAQPHLTITLVKLFDIYNPSNSLIANCYRMYNQYLSKLEQSKQLYKQAEYLLLSSLGLQNWIPSNKNVSIKSFSDFVETGRLDAEYYQPKYDEIEQKITSYKGGWDYVANCCCLKTKLYLPTKGSDYKYIELSNIGNQGEINGCLVDKGENLPSRARRLVETNDVMVSYLEGSLKSVAIVPEEYNNSLCSTGFHLVKPKDLNAETLLVLFKLPYIQSMLQKSCNGSIMSSISLDEFSKIKLPLIESSLQNQISDLIQESFKLKSESKQLLEDAKRMVELEIEKGGE